MYIYNVTTNIDETVHQNWLQWMKEIHIPALLATGKFTEAKMSRVLIEEEMGGVTYSVQYSTPSKEILQKYYEEEADEMREAMTQKFNGAFVSFRTEMEVIDIQKV